ncbi:hypothetical protein AUK40_04820 [Candidatus Wirthbacteria bacterium CG2_30_54_11]|uniref:Uncharacterized protein n=1 Tax=Candidatus Wirthbacteria bacterium CG2_30_54_11 TaxID=1817892 RepID=A0A1J5IQB9_9BACT|nr:MAG: hypothetical protein AUK40_04820 [Candidatus Wirthbacteria bacterium CG2_30_54_11]
MSITIHSVTKPAHQPLELDPFSLIFKRCLKDDVFRRTFLADPLLTVQNEGYLMEPDDLTELKALAQKVREIEDDTTLSEPAPPTSDSNLNPPT